MKIDLALLDTVSGGIAQSTTTSTNRPGWNTQGPAQWNLPAQPQWNGPQPKAPPTQPLGPWTPAKPWA